MPICHDEPLADGEPGIIRAVYVLLVDDAVSMFEDMALLEVGYHPEIFVVGQDVGITGSCSCPPRLVGSPDVLEEVPSV